MRVRVRGALGCPDIYAARLPTLVGPLGGQQQQLECHQGRGRYPAWQHHPPAGPTRVSSNLRDASFQIEDTVQPGWLLAEGHGDGRPGAADVIR